MAQHCTKCGALIEEGFGNPRKCPSCGHDLGIGAGKLGPAFYIVFAAPLVLDAIAFSIPRTSSGPWVFAAAVTSVVSALVCGFKLGERGSRSVAGRVLRGFGFSAALGCLYLIFFFPGCLSMVVR